MKKRYVIAGILAVGAIALCRLYNYGVAMQNEMLTKEAMAKKKKAEEEKKKASTVFHEDKVVYKNDPFQEIKTNQYITTKYHENPVIASYTDEKIRDALEPIKKTLTDLGDSIKKLSDKNKK